MALALILFIGIYESWKRILYQIYVVWTLVCCETAASVMNCEHIEKICLVDKIHISA
jgi:hypothetical protein